MEVDWETEVGGGAPIIDAGWAGFVDLRRQPGRVHEISEAAAFPPLAHLLLKLNGAHSAVWTSKCDLWQPAPAALACYVDMLPRDGSVFPCLPEAETFCRQLSAILGSWVPREAMEKAIGTAALEPGRDSAYAPDLQASLTLVIRQAFAIGAEGFGVTAYLGTEQPSVTEARKAMASAMAALADALLRPGAAEKAKSTLK
jgi:hypothetical protein